ncbi:MAG TPA: substrate-binding domain-containing protein [Anaerolineales bacterium]|nr:substrate-binding domain-containing protein [Anaerolineales bacterium]
MKALVKFTSRLLNFTFYGGILMKRQLTLNLVVVLTLFLAACGGSTPTAAPEPTQPAAVQDPNLDQYGERYDADPAVLTKSIGTTEGVPQIALAAIYRGGLPVDQARMDLAVKCWKEKICDTGTGGPITVALADGFGENFWRQMTHMEFILQALTYPEIGKIIYITALGDTQRSISDFRSLVAQDVDIIIGFPDAGDALLPAVREATERGITYITHSYGRIGEPGTDYPTFVAEDVCLLGQLFAETLNREVGNGKVAFLGGTPGNALSAYWQSCEEPALSPDLTLVGRADTSWTREGTLQAVSGFISSNPDIKGYSYEAADSFMGGVRAYEAAGLPLDIVVTLRTDEMSLFCEWQKINNPNFKIFYASGGNYQSRIALTAAMMGLKGYELPADGIILPTVMRELDASTCNPDVPQEASTSSLIPIPIFKVMGK